jgi:HEAT repeat protein/tetratricopeptide (TPR) repeat protein
MIKFFGGNSPERRVERLIAKGERLFQHGKEREGIEKFAEAASVLPEASKPSLHLGRAYFKLKEYELALKHYYKGLYFCEITDEPSILCEIAQIYLHMQRYDIVEEKLKKILRLEIPLPPSRMEKIRRAVIKGLAHLYLRTGRISDAIAQEKKLLERDPEDIQIIQMLAESHRRLGENHETRVLLRRAIELAKYSGYYADLASLERKLREVGFPDGTEFGIKEYLYAEHGSICLGTACDNGIEIELRQILSPLSLPELAVTLKRFIECIHAFSWKINCIVTAEKNSSLLTSIIAHLLNVPIKSVSRVANHDSVLVCQGLFKRPKQVKKFLKKLGKHTDSIMTFSLFTMVNTESDDYMPDIIGIPVKEDAKISWKSSNAIFPRSSVETTFFELPEEESSDQFVRQVLDKVYDLPEEENLAQQMAYYLTENTQIRPHLVQDSEPQALSPISKEEIMKRLISKKKEKVLAALKQIRSEDLQEPSLASALKTLYVENRDAVVRRIVGKYLMDVKHDEGLSHLVDLFHHPDTDVLLKLSIVDTLGLSSSRKISGVIVSALQDSHKNLRIHAVQYLNKLDLSMKLSPLFERLLNDISVIIRETIQYLTMCEFTPIYGVLQKFLPNLLHHKDAVVVHESLDAIQHCQDNTFTPAVIELLTHEDQHIIEHAIMTLGIIGDIDSGYHLLPFLEHKYPNFRYAAAESLTKLDHRRSIVFLMERIRKESPDVQEKLLKLLGEVGSHETVSFLVQFAEQHLENPQIVSAVMNTLAQLRNPRSLPFARKAAAKFSHEEILSHYISIAGSIGEEKDIENLITFLERPPAIQFRVAALLYKHGMKRYFHILKDGLRSKKIPINLLTIEILGEIGDELSIQEMFTVFNRHHPQLDKKIVQVIYRHSKSSDYRVVFLNLQTVDAEMVIQGVHRALQWSQTSQEVMNGLESLYALLQADAIPVIQQLGLTSSNRLILCGVIICLAQYDPTGCQDYLENFLQNDDIEVANTAYVMKSELNAHNSL